MCVDEELWSRERATNKLLNIVVTLLLRRHGEVGLTEDEVNLLQEELKSFHEAHGLDVEAVENWAKAGGRAPLDSFYKKRRVGSGDVK